ncbi:hypothetical protein IGI04_007525 [Brassica rapa subsp. trilocularis]|uniref:Uncharacterized protein n=1 Tax=Brassica rapa subsp. trilocularis TaxID=1813537 RepID=A0ABQ7NL72_BRACM|nr:hypothetical protein IGI04_007525 [Brassica rapa subsp. trilocularis]
MAATKMFLIKWYSSSTNLKIYLIFHSFSLFLNHLNVFGYAESRLDFQEVVWTSWKSSRLHGSLLTKSPFHNRSECFGFSDLEDFWDDLPGSRLKYNALDDFQEVFQTTSISVKSSGFSGSLLTKSSSISSGVQPCLCRRMIYNSFVCDDLQFSRPSDDLLVSRPGFTSFDQNLRIKSWTTYIFSRLGKHISKSIAKITSAFDQTTSRLLQEHKILNESDPPRIVSFFDSMNHKKCRIKILGFFSLMWRESERDVVFSS